MEKKAGGSKRKAKDDCELEQVSTKKCKKACSLPKEEIKPAEPAEVPTVTSLTPQKVQTSLDSFVKKKSETPKSAAIPDLEKELPIIQSVSDNSSTVLSNEKIRIYSWNVNGFRAVMEKKAIEDFISKEDPDILCFNETKLDEQVIAKEKYSSVFSKYSLYWNCCKSKGGYSGVAIFTKITPDSVKYGINNKDHDSEGRVICLEFPNYFLVSAYIPNAGQNLKRLDYRVKEWDIAFINYLNDLKKVKDVILCGDLNVAHKEIDIFTPKGHLKKAGFTIEERDNFTKLLNEGYIDTFRNMYPTAIKFSYFTARFGKSNLKENKGWRLDYFVVNKEAVSRLIDSEILNQYDASDHSPIKLTWKI